MENHGSTNACPVERHAMLLALPAIECLRSIERRTPALVVNLTDPVWSLEKGVTFPAVQREGDTTDLPCRANTDAGKGIPEKTKWKKSLEFTCLRRGIVSKIL